MAEEFMICNFSNCLTPVTSTGWVTRCSHVFCKDHGEKYFSKSSSKVKCPTCNDIITKHTDVMKMNVHPNDLIVCCVRPERALELAVKSTKLWCYQMKVKRKFELDNITQSYDSMAYNATTQLQSENKDLKMFVSEVEGQLQKVNNEMLETKRKLLKYKAAYETYRTARRHSYSQPLDPFNLLSHRLQPKSVSPISYDKNSILKNNPLF